MNIRIVVVLSYMALFSQSPQINAEVTTVSAAGSTSKMVALLN